MTSADDRHLLDGLRGGRPQAGREIIENYYQPIYRFLFYLTSSVHLAEDLTQETFSAAWASVAEFEGRSTLKTWLHRIAYSKFIDHQRAVRREASLCERLTIARLHVVDPAEAAMDAEHASRLYRALAEVDDADRTLLVLHYLQELSYREMAAVLSKPSGTLKWQVREALNRLRKLLNHKDSSHATRGTTEVRAIT
jgi:RNA polymerase sigma-70 factor, ECF subfamily